MATSGSKTVSFTNWDDLVFSWSAPVANQSMDNNTSKVTWSLKLVAGASGRISSSVGKSWSVTVNGKTYSGTNYIGIGNNETKTLASGETTITHNADGTKTFSYSFTQEIAITFSGKYISSCSGSGTGTLNSIARAINISTVTPNISQDSKSLIVNYSNPFGNNVSSLQACVAKTDGSTILLPYRDISKTGTSYTFSLTDANHSTFWGAMPTAIKQTFRLYLKWVYNGTTKYTYKTFNYTIVGGDISISPTAVDTNATTVALTNNNTVFISGYSKVSMSLGATFGYGASLSSYYIEYNGSTRITNNQNPTGLNVSSPTIKFYAKSKRGCTSSRVLSRTIVYYHKPTCSMVPNNPNLDEAITIDVKGGFYNGKFGTNGVTNALTIQYRYKVNDGAYGAWTTSTNSISYNNDVYSCEVNTGAKATYKDVYTVQIRVMDKLNTVTTEERQVVGATIFDWGKEDFSFNVPIDFPHGAEYGIYTHNSNGDRIWALQPSNDNDNLVLGYGNYKNTTDTGVISGSTNIYGGNINLTSANNITMGCENRMIVNVPTLNLATQRSFNIIDAEAEKGYDFFGLINALSNSYTFTTTVTAGSGYSNCSASVRLVGNTLKLWFKGTRSSAISSGDVTDEKILDVSFNHGGKIKELFDCSGMSHGGTLANFYASVTATSSTVAKISVYVSAAGGGDGWQGNILMPCTIDVNQFYN